jgi:hypothetical protein
MMVSGKKRCQCCGKKFVPDRRIGVRQKTCSAACRKIQKGESNKRYRGENPDYWLGRYEMVKAWRKDHPDYQKTWRQKRTERRMTFSPGEIQAEMFSKALDAFEKNVIVLREIQAEMPFQVIDITDRLAALPCRPT